MKASRMRELDLPDACDTQISFNIQAVVVLGYKDFFPRTRSCFDIRNHALGVQFDPREERQGNTGPDDDSDAEQSADEGEIF